MCETTLEVNGQPTTPFFTGNIAFLSLPGVRAEYRTASYINFNIHYWSPSAFSFTDCKKTIEKIGICSATISYGKLQQNSLIKHSLPNNKHFNEYCG